MISKKLMKQAADFFGKQDRVNLAYLFGSAARGDAGKLSDIDIAVLFHPLVNRKERFELQLEFIGKLTALLKTERIDLVVINEAPLPLQYEIIRANHPLFVRDREDMIDFEHRVLSRYLDRRYYETRAASNFLKKVSIGGL